MTDYPPLTVLILTYQRAPILHDTIQAIKDHLYYVGKTQIVVCDDGSTDGTQEMVKYEFPDVVLVRNNRIGLGAQHNRGLQYAWKTSPYTLALQDDMKLLTTLDLHPWISVMEKKDDIGFVRLWGVCGHNYQGQLESDQDIGVCWLRIWWHSPELFIPSDRPHLKHRRFNDHYGMYPEGKTTAETEVAFCHQAKDRSGMNGVKLDVIAPYGLDTERNFEHCSWGQRWRDVGL